MSKIRSRLPEIGRGFFILFVFVMPLVEYERDWTEEERLADLVRFMASDEKYWTEKEHAEQRKRDELRNAINAAGTWFVDGRWMVEADFDHAAHWEKQKALIYQDQVAKDAP